MERRCRARFHHRVVAPEVAFHVACALLFLGEGCVEVEVASVRRRSGKRAAGSASWEPPSTVRIADRSANAGSRPPAPLRRRETSFSHGAVWKALMSRYIKAIPSSGDAPCAVGPVIPCEPPLEMAVNSAIVAKAGAAARQTQSAATREALASRFSRVWIVHVFISEPPVFSMLSVVAGHAAYASVEYSKGGSDKCVGIRIAPLTTAPPGLGRRWRDFSLR